MEDDSCIKVIDISKNQTNDNNLNSLVTAMEDISNCLDLNDNNVTTPHKTEEGNSEPEEKKQKTDDVPLNEQEDKPLLVDYSKTIPSEDDIATEDIEIDPADLELIEYEGYIDRILEEMNSCVVGIICPDEII